MAWLLPRLLHPAGPCGRARLLHPAGPCGGARLAHPAGPCGGARLAHPQLHVRAIHASHANRLKEILEEEEEDTLKVEGRYITSPNTHLLVKCGEEEAGLACPLCALDLEVKHTDVLILSQFMKSNGEILPRRVTGLCSRQQRRLTWLIIMAQKAGLMPNLAPANSKRDPRKRRGSKKFNRYFDEDTLPK